jgi:GTP-binding protein EngB required for normal cell division
MAAKDVARALNSSHQLHLASNAQYADKLLGEVDAILAAATSKSAFNKYKSSLSPVQMKIIQDYVARIRAQMIRVLESQNIALPEPSLESVHSIRVTLAFVRIAFQECTPDRMRGYGEVPESKIRDLNGLVDEMVSAVDKLDSYLAQGLGQDLGVRLRLERAGAEMGLVQTLERVINAHGFVELRPTLSMIIERLETKSFEIALFGRVSSGKSSLLNHVVEADVVPVGVNPITAVPNRLMYGSASRLTVWHADQSPESSDISKLPEFVSEQHNPGNFKHMTRIVAELPSAKLRDGLVLVDTPGLGSLATSGAAETLAYLSRCDLGVVLIDAGSTLTEDDLSTIRTLYDAGIPASVLLSKSDLLSAEDQVRSLAYVAEQIHSRLGLTLPVRPVSTHASHAALLDDWLSDVVLPLYDRHQQLMEDSLRRKIGSLRETVETALRVRMERSRQDSDELDKVDVELRKALGRITEIRELCFHVTHQVRGGADKALAEAARSLTEASPKAPSAVVQNTLVQSAAESASDIFLALKDLARELAQTLSSAAQALGFNEAHQEDDLASAIQEIPRLDLGTLQVDLRPSLHSKISTKAAIRHAERGLRERVGPRVAEAFSSFGSVLDAWARRTLIELQLGFESHADGYRAHLDRMKKRGQISNDAAEAMEKDLALLEGPGRQEMMPVS